MALSTPKQYAGAALVSAVPLLVCIIIAVSLGALGGAGTIGGPAPPKTECDESMHGSFGAYRGCQTMTITGKECRPWEEEYRRQVTERTRLQEPQSVIDSYIWEDAVKKTPELLEAQPNYCRNILGAQQSIWCYVDKAFEDRPETERDESLGGRKIWWEYCNPLTEHACYVRPPYAVDSQQGLDGAYPGFDPTVSKEGIADFDRILMVTFFAVLSSSIGMVVAVRLKIATESFADAYDLERYKSYVKYLLVYFGSALVINFASSVTFITYRCVFHNEINRGTGGLWSKLIYLLATVFSGLLTNALMDRLLLLRASMLTVAQSQQEEGVMKCLDRITKLQMGLCAVTMLVGLIMVAHLIAQNGIYGSAIFIIAVTYRGLALFLAVLHVIVTVRLVRLLLRVAKIDQHGNTRMLIGFTVVAASTTIVVYLNWLLGFVNLYFIMPVDSIINDLCLAAVSFSAPVQDVANARRAEVAGFALAVGRGEADGEDKGAVAEGRESKATVSTASAIGEVVNC